MIKLKATRQELHFLCSITSPVRVEETIISHIKLQRIDTLSASFSILEIGLLCSKKYLFENKHSYKVGLKAHQAAALLQVFTMLDLLALDDWMGFVIMKWTNEIHEQLTNYQPKYYGRT